MKVERKENCKSVITFKVDGAEWTAEIEKAYTKLEKKVTVKAHRFSSAAVTKIESAGGTAEVI